MKIFQMTSTLNEIKDLLADIKRNSSDHFPMHATVQPAAPSAIPTMYKQSGDEMLRALSEIQDPAVHPEITQPH
jgi:hypothetical protein